MSQDLVAQALTALRSKNYTLARDCIADFAQNNPLDVQHYLIRGLSDIALEDWVAAEQTFADAAQDFPHQAQLWFNLGVAQENLGHLEDASASYEHSLDLDPNQGAACGNLANIYRRLGILHGAEDMARRAIALNTPQGAAFNSLGLALNRQGKFTEAGEAFREAARLEPHNPHAQLNLANLAVDQLDFAKAWPLFAAARAGSNDPALRHEESMARLLSGDYAAGWPLYEARLERPGALRVTPLCPRWNGEPLGGKKLLLVAEQGFGDVLMFCRYGYVLLSHGVELVWSVPASLQRLLASNLPGLVLPETEPLPAADYYAPLMSLPLALGKTLPIDAPPAPYLSAPEEPKLPQPAKDMRPIGLVWTGSPTHQRDHERSILLEQFAPLFGKVKAQFYAPFTGAGLEQITPQTPVIKLTKLITDFADTAALLKQLEVLVTVDTAAAHLAGALGVKTCLLLPHCPDWRWGTSGTMTPWYPNMTLLRQPAYGDWESVMEQLAEKLA
ncbi:MAG: tetratricopeptide repeat protein [Alphaproteobacteria bacterium]|nr:tetratricopeptide repeat protein [Alphaproteobacteria bacterium]